MTNKRSDKKRGLIFRVTRDMREDMGKVILCFAVLSVTKLCLAFAPRLSGAITNAIAEGLGMSSHTAKLCLLFSLFIIVGYASDGIVDRIMLRAADRYGFKMRYLAQQKLDRMPIAYIDMHPAGDMLARLTTDLTALTTAITTIAGSIFSQIVLFIAIAVLMFVMDRRLALSYLLVIPLGTCASSLVIMYSRKVSQARADCQGLLSAKAADTFAAHSVVKAYGCEENMLADFDDLLNGYHRNNIKAQFNSGLVVPTMTIVNNVGYIACCILSGYLMIKGKLTIGEFQAFLIYGNMVMAPVTAITSGIVAIVEGFASGKRFYEFLDGEEEPEDKTELLDEQDCNGDISFEHVSFRYVPDIPLMQDVSFSVRSGMTAAIVGPTGAGKTTLVNLLMRFYEIDGGNIRIDGEDVADMSRAAVRRRTGIVLQDSWVFEGTVSENIAYGCEGAGRQEIIDAAKRTGCDRFIDKLPNGYDTELSEANMPLSDGEKQMLSVARAVLADRKILVLDEATSQVDTRTEYAITQAMEELMKGRTTFIIAHRLFTIRNADIILYMENGDVKETGTHEELMALNGKYAGLYMAAKGAGAA